MDVICYRGGGGEFPENTIEGISNCYNVNPDWWIEIDLRVTKDNQVVLIHDETLIRLAGMDRRVDEMTYHELKSIDIGWHFYKHKKQKLVCNPPLLQDVLSQFHEAKFVLDIHAINGVEPVMKMIDKSQYEDSIIIVSEYDSVIEKVKLIAPMLRCGAGTNEVKRLWLSSKFRLDRWFELKSDILIVPEFYKGKKLLNSRLKTHVRSRKKSIWIYTMNIDDVASRYAGEPLDNLVHTQSRYDYYAAQEIDGVFTDRPSELAASLV